MNKTSNIDDDVRLVELQHVSFQMNGNRILDDVSWNIEAGQHWAILGPNGSGKTTLVRIVTGLEWPNAGGTVQRMGQQLQDLRALHRSIGWVSHALASRVPARECVLKLVASGRVAELGLRPPIATNATEEDLAAATRLLASLGMSQFAERRFVTLSQGEQQKVLLLRALMAAPLLIVLDEPCAGLDPAAREDFLQLLAQQLENPAGPTILLVTHHVEEILPGIDHALFMQAGRITKQGATREVVTPAQIESVYGCARPEFVERAGRIWPLW